MAIFSAILAGIIAAAGALWNITKTITKEALDAAKYLFDKSWDLYKHAYDMSPKIMAFFTFLFFISVIGGIISFFLSFMFFCFNGNVHQADSVAGGVTTFISLAARDTFDGNFTDAEYEQIINGSTSPINFYDDNTARGIVQVRCSSANRPRMSLWGIDIFDPEIYLLGAALVIIFKWMIMIRRLKSLG